MKKGNPPDEIICGHDKYGWLYVSERKPPQISVFERYYHESILKELREENQSLQAKVKRLGELIDDYANHCDEYGFVNTANELRSRRNNILTRIPK